MNINVLNAYRNPYTNGLENLKTEISRDANVVAKTNADKQSDTKNSINQANKELLTKKERTFFKQLFPENSDLIEKHVLFTRNGKLKTTEMSKGMIVDGRV